MKEKEDNTKTIKDMIEAILLADDSELPARKKTPDALRPARNERQDDAAVGHQTQ